MTRCPECGNETHGGQRENPVRCRDCGATLGTANSSEFDPDVGRTRHVYDAPFGRIVAQIQPSGCWAAAHNLSPSSLDRAKLTRLLTNHARALREIGHPALALFHSFDAKRLRCVWRLPGSESLVPLSTLQPPRTSQEVRTLIESLAHGLETLHQAGLGAFDLAPELVFVRPDFAQSVLVPTPWLASLVRWQPAQPGTMPFVAPELDQPEHVPDPKRGDLFNLGALAWFLLTARHRDVASATLPSELSAELAGWDAFIDGCCRRHPERRFESVSTALDCLPTADLDNRRTVATADTSPSSKEPVPQPGPSADAQDGAPRRLQAARSNSTTRRRRGKYLIAGIIALVLTGLYLRRDQIASTFPAAAGFLASYERGFGDTILKYEDRTYDGAEWQKLQEVDSLIAIASVEDLYSPKLRSVVGWDEESFWILCDARIRAAIFHNSGGHWTFLGAKDDLDSPAARPLSEHVLYAVGNSDSEPSLYRIHQETWTVCAKMGRQQSDPELCIVADDLLFGLGRYDLEKYDARVVTKMPIEKYKEALVHRQDNTPLKRYPARRIRLTKTSSKGIAWGVVGQDGSWSPWKLVRFQDGIWYEVDEVGELRGMNAAWLGGGSGHPRYFVFVGDRGKVLVHEIGGTQQEHSLTGAQEYTSGDLLAVWGVSRDRYWVIDKSGTVWGRADNRWRTVVRGMYRDDIEFCDAWVSPTGTVIAITEDAVYRLD